MVVEWREVVTHPQYEVSDSGVVRRSSSGLILKQWMSNVGYWMVSLSGPRKHFTVHSLVALTFIGARPPGAVCRHINDDRLDNRVANLIWGTQSENIYDSVRNGKHPRAARTNCYRNHPLIEWNIVKAEVARGRRSCLACQIGRARVRIHGGSVDIEADRAFRDLEARYGGAAEQACA